MPPVTSKDSLYSRLALRSVSFSFQPGYDAESKRKLSLPKSQIRRQ